jgi:hypothetical protein
MMGLLDLNGIPLIRDKNSLDLTGY